MGRIMLENLRPILRLPQGVRFIKPLRFTLLEPHATLLEQLPKAQRDGLVAQALETLALETLALQKDVTP
jgi:hypothetical protein